MNGTLCLIAQSIALACIGGGVVWAEPWVTYEGGTGPGQGKHVVLVSGDEEYRSEEAMPQLGKILAERHGFQCTVLFAIDPKSELIQPNIRDNIPGLSALADADLLILFTRYRALPDEQMQFIDDYLRAGKPLIGIRTSTHAFNFPNDSKWARYSNDYQGEPQAWQGGFGRLVLGEMWIRHHGRHRHQSTRGVPAQGMARHPILRGISSGDVWGPSDVYGVRLPLPGDSQPILLGEVVERRREYEADDAFYGMRPNDGPAAAGDLNSPMMPIAWTKTYRLPDGQTGRALASTIGASADLAAAGTRRLLVNAVYWLLEMAEHLPPEGADVELIGSYTPTRFEFRDDRYWEDRRMSVDEFRQ